MRIEPSEEYVNNVLDKYKRNTKVDFSTGELKYNSVPILWARSELLYHIYSELENLMAESALSILKRISKPYGANFYTMMKEQGLVERLQTHENIYKYLVSETMAIGWGERQPFNPWCSANFLTKRGRRDPIADQVNLKTLLCRVKKLKT